MNLAENDLLLKLGKMLALILQVLCALAGAVVILAIPVIILISEDMLPGLVDANDFPLAAQFLLPGVSLLLLIAVSLAALFFFFGKMRAIIGSVGAGDPFIPENARRLNAMAWLLLVHESAALLIGELRAYVANLTDEQGGHTIDYGPYDLDGILIVIVLFILARVFRYGAAMREDLEGTV